MIKSLVISNIAVIPALDLDLEPGFTVLTGETGAGKSILVDALGLVLGERGSAELLRTGEERASVEAVLQVAAGAEFLAAHGLPGDGDEIVVRREILATGKGRATVNGAIVSLNVLRELAPRVAMIHGQHEPQGLLDPASHTARLDVSAGTEAGVASLAPLHTAWRAAVDALEALRRDRREHERRRETLDYQAAEIEKAGLSAGEEEELRRDKVVQANAGKLMALADEAYSLLYDDEAAVLARLGLVQKRLADLAAIDPGLEASVSGLPAARAQLDDIALQLRDYREGLQVTPGRVDEIESRLAVIERLKKKYGATVEEVLAFAARCREELGSLGDPETREKTLEAECARTAAAYLEAAQALSTRRRAAASGLERRVEAELKHLAMERTRFKVRFVPETSEEARADSSRWTATGLESAEFLISPNPGEELRPLARVASGGELSRVMLALMSASRLDGYGATLVFDEADAGIGGRVAEVVGRKLRGMADAHQVLCVTHLPQIAALGNHHHSIEKKVERGRTVTVLHRLGEADRVEELARMLGGETITARTREHAREMLKETLKK